MLLAALCFILLLFVTAEKNSRMISAPVSQPKERIYIIDAGHGGADGGAVGVNNTVEKEINLSIALKLNEIMQSFGFKTVLTRREDIMTCDEGLHTLREKKVSDIHNRLNLLESTENAVLISIHQNSYPGKTSFGTQVFYSPGNEQSEILAQCVQSTVIDMLQKDNKRKIKKAGTDIYLLYHAKSPAVLVECGFITNPSDCEKLKKEEYQNEIAFAVFCGVMKYENGGI